MADVAPFTFLPVAAPAVTLVMLGSGAGLFRPGWLGGASYRAALASALVAIVWIYSAIARLGIGPAESAAMAAGAVFALALAHESSRSGRLAHAPAPDDQSLPTPAGSVDAISG
jgi:hypothetical protein